MQQFTVEQFLYFAACCSCAFIAWYSPNLNPTLCVNFIYFSAHWATQFDSLSSKFFDRNPCVTSMFHGDLALWLYSLVANCSIVILTPRTVVFTHFWKHDSTRKLYSLTTPMKQIIVSKTSKNKNSDSPSELLWHSTSETPSSGDLPKIYWTLLSDSLEHFPFQDAALQLQTFKTSRGSPGKSVDWTLRRRLYVHYVLEVNNTRQCATEIYRNSRQCCSPTAVTNLCGVTTHWILNYVTDTQNIK